MSRKDLSKAELYEAVKTLVETDINHIHLCQQKLFTLFSIAFQYLLYRSTKDPGHYIIRVEDSYLADKLARKAKDETTRKFTQKLLLPRRLKYQASTFHLDFFHLNTWNITKDLPREKVIAALIVKNTSNAPLDDNVFIENPEEAAMLSDLPKDYFLHSLTEFVPKTITIAFNQTFEGLSEVKFPFIKETAEVINGVRIAADINMNDLD
ncbi:MAG: hypothetical protein JNM93_12965 [Bacteriovoracaceae bacterium]|nr:hypothetical protein [Bacteriovoracaceae bacterium]